MQTTNPQTALFAPLFRCIVTTAVNATICALENTLTTAIDNARNELQNSVLQM